MNSFKLGAAPSLEQLAAVARGALRAEFPAPARARVARARKTLLAVAAARPVYGVNTGFGDLASQRIAEARQRLLQRNLVLSHACGIGPLLSEEESRAILFLRLQELGRGHSGVRPELIEAMIRILNSGATPLIPSRGSVGASGDLAPHAHMALLVLGEGKARLGGKTVSARKALLRARVEPAQLEIKEGIGLINGTQAMQAVGGLSLLAAGRVWRASQLAGAMSLEAMTGTPEPFEDAIHRLKPHPGQLEAARGLRHLMRASEIRESHRHDDPRVQDPYSLRCMPQVHGAVLDQLRRARETVEIEMGSITDNPLVSNGRVYSGGNFHGQALSFAFDGAAIALTALGNISERRIFQLISCQAPGLKPFLAHDPGVESGWMIAQVAAAALSSENKSLAHPASADSVPTSANKEDFVSMGMGAALKLKQVVWNAAQIVGIELLCAAQGVECHSPLRPGSGVAAGLKVLRKKITAARKDEILSGKMEAARELVLGGGFEGIV